jgi:hypothetical protein
MPASAIPTRPRAAGTLGPDYPAIIVHRYWCPSCDAPAGEPCRLSPTMQEQRYAHVARHREAQRAEWRRLQLEIDRGIGDIASLSYARV